MFEYYGSIHVYCPWVGADEPLAGPGVMIYKHIVELETQMLNAKFKILGLMVLAKKIFILLFIAMAAILVM